jgi:3-oxoadipate enol-lactonase / 4-carboxymuconolactone decarboxylase
MPHADLGDLRIHYSLDGAADGPVLVLSNSLGADLHMWDRALPALAGHFRILRYDTRGHGQSTAPAGPYKIDDLGEDLISLLDALEIESCHFCGVSLGGMTGMWLAIHAPQRIEKLILSNTAVRIGTAEGWNDRIRRVNESGVDALADEIIARWFTPSFLTEHQDESRAIRSVLAACPAEGYAGCCAAIRDADLLAELPRISAPTLVITGTFDPVIPVCESRVLHDKIGGTIYLELPSAHLSPVERPQEFNGATLAFLSSGESLWGSDRARFSAGMKARRSVLGDAHVNKAQASTIEFNAEFQDLITRYAWGEIWTRPGLPRKTRSLLTIAMMVALHHSEELRMHIRAAFNNGVTRDEIKETLLQCAIYCGVPSANHAFKLAGEVFAEIDTVEFAKQQPDKTS